ncbi:MAG: hypothetical protein ACM3UT_09815 [Chloroflexota bacterium]
MKFLISVILITAALATATGQNLIGFRYGEIRNYMKENYKDLNYNKVNNSKFTYLKYSDNLESQTLLFFLDKDSVCKSIRIICDEGAKSQKVKEFNSIYKRKGENRWIDSRQGVNYLIELKDEDWASVITVLQMK